MPLHRKQDSFVTQSALDGVAARRLIGREELATPAPDSVPIMVATAPGAPACYNHLLRWEERVLQIVPHSRSRSAEYDIYGDICKEEVTRIINTFPEPSRTTIVLHSGYNARKEETCRFQPVAYFAGPPLTISVPMN